MPGAARVGDMHSCTLPQHPGGPIAKGAPTVLIDGVPAARQGDIATCLGPDVIAMGAPTVLIEHLPAARLGDVTAHGGTIAQGSSSVLVGMSAQEAALADASANGSAFCEECQRG